MFMVLMVGDGESCSDGRGSNVLVYSAGIVLRDGESLIAFCRMDQKSGTAAMITNLEAQFPQTMEKLIGHD